MSARVPTSRAYWNLRAEQVMDKVFERSIPDPEDQRLVPVHVAVHEPEHASPATTSPPLSTAASTTEQQHRWLIPLLTGVAAAAVVSCGWLISHWQHSRAQLDQERIALLVERLRERPIAQPRPVQTTAPAAQLTPASEAVLKPAAASVATQASATEQVTSLKPLTLPIRTIPDASVSAVSPPADPTALEPIPLLTGVVHGPGGNSSAIFQIGKASLSAGIGERIGSSGWVLSTISDTGAVIERNGQRQALSVGGAF